MRRGSLVPGTAPPGPARRETRRAGWSPSARRTAPASSAGSGSAARCPRCLPARQNEPECGVLAAWSGQNPLHTAPAADPARRQPHTHAWRKGGPTSTASASPRRRSWASTLAKAVTTLFRSLTSIATQKAFRPSPRSADSSSLSRSARRAHNATVKPALARTRAKCWPKPEDAPGRSGSGNVWRGFAWAARAVGSPCGAEIAHR